MTDLEEPVGGVWDIVTEVADLEEQVCGVGDIVAKDVDLEEPVGGVGDIVAMFMLNLCFQSSRLHLEIVA